MLLVMLATLAARSPRCCPLRRRTRRPHTAPRRACLHRAALEALGATPPERSPGGRLRARACAGRLRLEAARLEVECLMTAARRYCRGRAPTRSAASSTWTSSSRNLLGDAQLIPTEKRYQIMSAEKDYRRELARRAAPHPGRARRRLRLRIGAADDDARPGGQHRSLLSGRRRRDQDRLADLRLVAGVVHRQRRVPEMRNTAFLEFLGTEAKHLEQAGLLRREPLLTSPPGPRPLRSAIASSLNFASSDYLGLSHIPRSSGRHLAPSRPGAWASPSPRMAAGTLPICTPSSSARSRSFSAPATRSLYPSGYHANTGLFESLLTDRDYLFCDEMIRPQPRRRHAPVPRPRLLVSQPGHGAPRGSLCAVRAPPASASSPPTASFRSRALIANLRDIYSLAAKYNALVVVDDSQGIGVLGDHGRGTHDQLGLTDRIDLVTGTFGAALGGGAGGFVAGRKEIVGWLRQKSRSYLSSTALPPASVAAAQRALELLRTEPQLREQLDAQREAVPRRARRARPVDRRGRPSGGGVLIRDAVAAQRLTDFLYRKGIFAIGFCHPVVPEGAARIRVQITVRHTQVALPAGRRLRRGRHRAQDRAHLRQQVAARLMVRLAAGSGSRYNPPVELHPRRGLWNALIAYLRARQRRLQRAAQRPATQPPRHSKSALQTAPSAAGAMQRC